MKERGRREKRERKEIERDISIHTNFHQNRSIKECASMISDF